MTAQVGLFRTEALSAATANRYGRVVLARPISHTLLTLLFAAVAVALLSFVTTFSVTRKSQISGQLLPIQGLVRVQPPQPGVIAQRNAREGQAVKAGDVLFAMASQRIMTSRGDTATTVSALIESRRASLVAERAEQGQQDERRIASLRRRTQELFAESHRIDEQIALQQRRVALAQQAVKRYADLQAANFVSAASAQDHEAELLDQQQRLADLQRAKDANARDQNNAGADLADQQVQAQRNQRTAERNIASLDQDLTENEGRLEITVRAPMDGTVTAISADIGQTVTAGQTLASILPASSELEAELYAPSRAAGFIKAGMPVLLRYQAYPYQKFGQFHGEVRDVSNAAVPLGELTATSTPLPGAGSEAVYRVRVRLGRQAVEAYGVEQSLKSGMAVDASVLLETRRLYEWMLEPLYSITGRM